VKYDATSLNPDTARIVYLQGEAFSREGLETAWLHLDAHSGARLLAAKAMHEQDGWSLAQAVAFVDAAQRWTGRVVHNGGEQ
jgi:hypothetical protein